MNKRLYKSDDAVFAGICGGIGDYFELDPTLVRILFIIICFMGLGIPIVIYLLVMIVMPKRPQGYASYIDVKPTVVSPSSSAQHGVVSQYGGAQAGSSAQTHGGVRADDDMQAGAWSSSGYRASSKAAMQSGNASASEYDPAATQHRADPQGTRAAESPNSRSCISNCSHAPGSAYTTANPQAYDAISSPDKELGKHGMKSGTQLGIVLGIVLISMGVFGLLNIFLGIRLWRFWPMILLLIGIFTLLTPNSKGWSLERAGNGIFTITLAFVLQLWMLEFFGLGVFIKTFLTFWPAILVAIGLGIIAAVSKKTVFSLFGSLLISAALLFGVWFFGELPGYSARIDLPLLEDRQLSFTIPASPDAPNTRPIP